MQDIQNRLGLNDEALLDVHHFRTVTDQLSSYNHRVEMERLEARRQEQLRILALEEEEKEREKKLLEDLANQKLEARERARVLEELERLEKIERARLQHIKSGRQRMLSKYAVYGGHRAVKVVSYT